MIYAVFLWQSAGYPLAVPWVCLAAYCRYGGFVPAPPPANACLHKPAGSFRCYPYCRFASFSQQLQQNQAACFNLIL